MDRKVIEQTIKEMGLEDFSSVTIRDIAKLSKKLETILGEKFVHLEMGVPGLKPSQIGVDAEINALKKNCAQSYPPNDGIPEIKNAASRFVKAFIDLDIDPLCCMPTTGSMQGTFAVFTTLKHADPKKDTVLFIHPGFPVQTTQCEVIGLKTLGIDIYGFRGEKLISKLREILSKGNICSIVYSNPNNPSWVCFTDEELQGIGKLATEFDVVVLEDLAYFAMDFRNDLSKPFEAPFQPSVGKYTKNYVVSISGSKAFSYAGQRIGVSCISNDLYHRKFKNLEEKFGVAEFGNFMANRVLYTLSSGVTHSVQFAMSAMMNAASDGKFNFLNEVKEYGRRAKYLKDVLLNNGFYLVYDNDMGKPLADGFYFTVQYPNMTAVELTKELMFYGIAVFPLNTMGSLEQGVRICTSFFHKDLENVFKERIEKFAKDFPVK